MPDWQPIETIGQCTDWWCRIRWDDGSDSFEDADNIDNPEWWKQDGATHWKPADPVELRAAANYERKHPIIHCTKEQPWDRTSLFRHVRHHQWHEIRQDGIASCECKNCGHRWRDEIHDEDDNVLTFRGPAA